MTTTTRRILYLAAGPLSLYLAFTVGRTTAPWEDPLYIPIESRADCLEARLVPDDRGDDLIVRAWMWDGSGVVAWTRDLTLDVPLSALWDESDKGQYAIDAHRGLAEREIYPDGGDDGRLHPERCTPNLHYMTETRAGTTECY